MKSQNNILLFLNIFITIIYLFLAIYGSIFFWNRDYTIARYWVEQKEKHSYAIFMNRTIFSGEGFGGQDFTNILIALALVLYVLSFNSKFNYWFFPLRKYTGFMLGVAILLTLTWSRLLRTFFARARPINVIEGKETFSHLLMFGSYRLEDAFNHGCFPSGHTFSAMFLIVLAFIAIKTRKTWLIILIFLLSIAFGISMGVGRVMFGSHYPGDVLWSIIFSIFMTGWLYFMVFRIPQQEKGTFNFIYKPLEGSGFIIKISNIVGPMWELRYSFLYSLFSISFFIILIGVKYSILNFTWYWPLISITGLIFSIIFYRRISVLFKDSIKHQISE